jgi:hypothetical protein
VPICIDDARFDAVAERIDLLLVFAENAHRQTILSVVRLVDRLLEIFHRRHGKNGQKDLLLEEGMVSAQPIDHGRREAARNLATVPLDVLSADFDEFDEIVEWIADEEAGAVMDRLGNPDVVPVLMEAGPVRLEIVYLQTEMLRR